MIELKNKRGQEEIVGFVLIVLIVSIVFVILLAIFLKTPKTIPESVETRQFLESSMTYTSDCAIGYEPNFVSVGELMGACYDGKVCVGGNSSCLELNRTLNGLIEGSWGIGSGSYYTGYELEAYYNSSSGSAGQREIAKMARGNCTAAYRGADYFFAHGGGNIDVLIKICTSS